MNPGIGNAVLAFVDWLSSAYCVEKVAVPDFRQILGVLFVLPEKRSSIVERSERSSYAIVIANISEATFSTQ